MENRKAVNAKDEDEDESFFMGDLELKGKKKKNLDKDIAPIKIPASNKKYLSDDNDNKQPRNRPLKGN